MGDIRSLSQNKLEKLLAKYEANNFQQTEKPNNQSIRLPSQESSGLGAFAQGALDSATLGFAPKIIGGIGAPLLKLIRPDLYADQNYSDVYKDLRDFSRNEMRQASEQNPLAYGAGNLAGGLPLPFPAKTVKGAAGLGALYGAAQGLGSSDSGNLFEINEGNIGDALSGGAFGGVFGGVTQKAINKLFPEKILNIDGLNKRKSILKKSDLDYNKNNSDIAPEFNQYNDYNDIDILKSLNPRNIAPNERIKLSEKFNIPLTKGEALNSSKELLKEEHAIQGRLGSSNEERIKAFNKERTKQYHDKVDELARKFSGGEVFTERGANLGPAVNKLAKKALEEKKIHSKLYDEALKSSGSINGESIDFFIKNIKEDLQKRTLTKDNVDKAYKELNALGTQVKNIIVNGKKTQEFHDVDIKALEAWRQGMNDAYDSARINDKKNAGAIRYITDKYDKFMDAIIDHAIDSNDTNLLSKFKTARSAAANWYSKYKAKNPKEYGKKFIQDIIENRENGESLYTNEQIANKLLGTSELGFTQETGVAVKYLKKLMPEIANDVKIEAAQKLITPLLKPTPNIITYKNNLNKFIKNNPTLAKELFTKEQLKDLIDLGELGRFIFTREKSAMNPGGTANIVLDGILNSKYLSWLKPVVNKVELNQEKIKATVNKVSPETKIENLTTTKQNTKLPALAKASQLALSKTDNKLNQEEESKRQKNKMEKRAASVARPSNRLSDLSDSQLESLKQKLEKGKNDGVNNLLNKISKVESGNNPNAKSNTSTASGLFQITDDTWKSLRQKYNIKGNKNDPQVQRQTAALLLNENKNTLTKAIKRKPTNGELYVAHFLGAGDAAKLIKAKNSNIPAARLFPQAAKANRSIFFANGKPISANTLYEKLTNLV